jgi:hypothetical protein
VCVPAASPAGANGLEQAPKAVVLSREHWKMAATLDWSAKTGLPNGPGVGTIAVSGSNVGA